jgi:uncharacterized protein
MTKEEYKSNSAPTINHFMKSYCFDKMNTWTGKIAPERHRYMDF